MGKMKGFEPAIIENGTYKRIKVEPFSFTSRTGLSGEAIDQILRESENKGFLSLPLKQRDTKYEHLRNTYLAQCTEKGQLYVEVFADEEWNRAFACFDTISFRSADFSSEGFAISEMILWLELKTYYERLPDKDRWRLFLPAHMNPYTRSQHKINFFILPKQICFSFYQNQPEIFYFVLKKLRFGI